MPKYEVVLSREVVETQVVEVDASNKDTAKVAGMDALNYDGFKRFKSGPVKVTSVDKV